MLKTSNDNYLKELGLRQIMRESFRHMRPEFWDIFRQTGTVRLVLQLPPTGTFDEPSNELNVVQAITYTNPRHPFSFGSRVIAECMGVREEFRE